MNGLASVLGSVLAMVLAWHFGFSAALLTGAGAYLVAATLALAAVPIPPEEAANEREASQLGDGRGQFLAARRGTLSWLPAFLIHCVFRFSPGGDKKGLLKRALFWVR